MEVCGAFWPLTGRFAPPPPHRNSPLRPNEWEAESRRRKFVALVENQTPDRSFRSLATKPTYIPRLLQSQINSIILLHKQARFREPSIRYPEDQPWYRLSIMLTHWKLSSTEPAHNGNLPLAEKTKDHWWSTQQSCQALAIPLYAGSTAYLPFWLTIFFFTLPSLFCRH
jgi:hypothetical protein